MLMVPLIRKYSVQTNEICVQLKFNGILYKFGIHFEKHMFVTFIMSHEPPLP